MWRQAKYPWLLLVLALAAIAVPIAEGTSTAKDPRVAGLTRKVNALQANVAALKSSVSSLKSDVATLQTNLTAAQTDVTALKTATATLTTKANCIASAAGVVLRGIGANDGYLYTADGMNLDLRSALDAPLQGEKATFYAATVNPQCVTSGVLFRATIR
jgi:hypothetical protein